MREHRRRFKAAATSLHYAAIRLLRTLPALVFGMRALQKVLQPGATPLHLFPSLRLALLVVLLRIGA